MIPRNGLPIKNQKAQKSRPSLLGRLLLFLVCGLVLFFGFGLLARISSLQVSLASYEHIVVTNTDEITEALQVYLQERYLYPRSNKLWFSKNKAEEFVMQTFPRIGYADISLKDGMIHLYGDEREGKYLWCGREVTVITLDTPCYFVDATGFIFDTAPYFSGTSYLRLYGGDITSEIVGSSAFPSEIFTLETAFTETLNPFGLRIQAIYLSEQDQIEFLLFSNNEIPKAPRLRHYMQNDSELALHNLERALQQENVLLDIMTQYDRLEYLDVRFKNQLVYKFFDTETQEEEPQESTSNDNENLEQDSTNIETEEDIENSTEG